MSINIERPKAKSTGLQINLSGGKTIEIKTTKKLDIKLGGHGDKPDIIIPKNDKPEEPPKQEPKPAPPPKAEPKPAPPPQPKEEPKAEPVPKPEPKDEKKPEPQKKEEKANLAENKSSVSLKSSSQETLDEEDNEEEEDYKGEVLDESRKKTINLVFIGHVDAGKSTLCGHLLFDAGIVDQRTIERYQKEAQQKNRQSWYYSWVMDLADTERQKGKTEEVGVAHFETDVYKYTVLDAPGHRSYVPQMIGGAAQADVAVLVISARTGEFESGFEKGGQTSEHLLIAKTAGVRFVICAINKMDDPTVNWSKKRYDEIIQKFNPFITTEIGFKKEQFVYIPIAALGGGNLKEKDPNCTWYDGPTLFEAFDLCPTPPRNESDKFRMPVIDKYKTKYLFALGKIEKGVIHEGSPIVVMPSGAKGTITSIFDDETKIRTAVPGDNIRVHLSGIELADINAGSVICQENSPCNVAEKAIVKLRFTPSAPQFITAGFEAVCHIHTDTVQMSFEKILEVLRPKKEKNPKFVRAGQMVQCIIKFDRPICIETFESFPQLGRFIIRHESMTIAVGVVERLPKKAATK